MEMNFLLVLVGIILFASIVHGSIGFGFGMIATPVVAMFTDMQTTITYMLIPTMLTSLVAVRSEGNFFEALKKFWFIILLMVVFSGVGTGILLYINSDYFKLLLSMIIFVYLIQSSVNIQASFISKYKKASTYALGILGGIISGLTNAVAPLVIIYALELKYSKQDIIQLSNLCFLFTKIGQLVVFLSFGAFSMQAFELSIMNIVLVSIGLFFGLKIKKKIDQRFYAKILKVILFFTASFLVIDTING
ncbi:MAG: putative membrane protein YfcA [Sulfurimonas sp.]|jgi:uncharacterized membrane protein YfcA